MTPTRRPATGTFLSAMAAYPTAPDGSTAIFMISQIWRIAKAIAASETVAIPSTLRRMTGKVRSPTSARRPSAMLDGWSTAWRTPDENDRLASAAPSGSPA